MGRGKDKRIELRDIQNMSPVEVSSVLNAISLNRVKIRGTALVRDRHGNARYGKGSSAGRYGEQNV